MNADDLYTFYTLWDIIYTQTGTVLAAQYLEYTVVSALYYTYSAHYDYSIIIIQNWLSSYFSHNYIRLWVLRLSEYYLDSEAITRRNFIFFFLGGGGGGGGVGRWET